jgi:protein-L-isoaspartate(D-aspartate) O-methyltransferase
VEGFPTGAPYDGILIEGAVPEIPAVIAEQLAEGGRLATVLTGPQGARAVSGRRFGSSFSVTPAFDCATLALQAFARRPGFVF